MSNSRYMNKQVCKETFDNYIEGAKNGTVGHFSMYPMELPKLNFNYVKKLESKLEEGSFLNGIYIHWPYCFLKGEKVKCDFCMCNTKNTDYDKKNQYFTSLLNEIIMYAKIIKEPAKMMYIGGGTPLSMSLNELERLFSTLYNSGIINQKTFISVETRPDTITFPKLHILEKYNVDRLSIGVESLDEYVIGLMGRNLPGRKYEKVVEEAINMVKNSSINFLNIDLLYSYPGETFESVKNSLQKLLEYSPDSFSIYSLGMPYGLTDIESSERELKTLEYRKSCLAEIIKIMKKNKFFSVADSIWASEDIKSYANLKDGKGYANFYNQTNTLPFDIWIGIGVGAGGYIEGVGPILNTNDIESYIKKIGNGEFGVNKGKVFDENELMRAEIILSFLHRHLDVEKFVYMHGKRPDEVFKYEFDVLRDSGILIETDSFMEIKERAVYLLQGIVRLFFSCESESIYREKEILRIDYKKYGVDYRNLY